MATRSAFAWNGGGGRELGHLCEARRPGITAAPDHRPRTRAQSCVVSGPGARSRSDASRDDLRVAILVVPSRGGPEREVLESPRSGVLGDEQGESSHGRLIAVSWLSQPRRRGRTRRIQAVDIATGQTRPVTRPPPDSTGGIDAVDFARRSDVAFVRRSGVTTGALQVQALSAGLEPSASRDGSVRTEFIIRRRMECRPDVR